MRIALGIEYNGHSFFGWQTQEKLLTVQGCVEAALTQIANSPIKVFCAGRTDAGVHAMGQVVHFDTLAVRDLRAWVYGVNAYLPSTISVKWAKPVEDNFHARFSANARRYCYVIYNHSVRSAVFTGTTWHSLPLDCEKMHMAAQCLLGEHDFTSFRSSQCESKTPMRCVQEIAIKRKGDFIFIEIQANAFLHHMVRNIVGVLMRVGGGRDTPENVQAILQHKDRTKAAETAPAQGLYLTNVVYPTNFEIPQTPSFSLFF